MKILDICHYYTFPPRAGGQLRIFNLNREISKKHKVTQLSFTPALTRPKIHNFKNYEEIVIPKLVYMGVAFLVKKVLRLPFDFVVPFFFRFTRYSELEHHVKESDIVQVEHPWLFSFVYPLAMKHKKKIILVEHNIEFQLQDIGLQVLPFSVIKKIMDYIRKVELFALKNSDCVIVTSEEDKSFMTEYFGINSRKIFLVPNGAKFRFFNERKDSVKKLRRKLKGKYKNIILFSGAGHPPNYEAVRFIEKKLSKKMPNSLFLIAGSVHKKGRKGNILYTGPVKDILPYFHISDAAINPIIHGSGTNLKMLDYMSSGLPVITTRFGARGFNLCNNEECIISELENFEKHLNLILKDRRLYKMLSRNAVRFARNYDWRKISKKLNKVYSSIA